MRRIFLLTALLATLILGACGTRGPLTLPPPQAKTPIAAASSPTQPAPSDLNRPKETA